MFKPTLEEAKSLMQQYNKIPISLEMYMDFHTPIAVVNALKEKSDRYFLLESIEGDERMARYTFIGANPSASFYIRCGTSFYATKEEVKRLEGNPLDCLKELMTNYKAPQGSNLPPFTGGAVGYFGYDMIRYVEKLPDANKDELEIPDVKLMFFDDVIAFDHVKQKIFLITNLDGQIKDIEAGYEEAKNRLKDLMHLINQPTKRREVHFDKEVHFKSTISKEAFMDKVEKAKSYIRNGDVFQVVLSQRFKAKLESNLLDVYRVLRTINPSPYMYLMQFDDLQVAGASPEKLVSLQDGIITTRPIAGTHPRGKTQAEDQLLDEALLSNEKELSEHNMLVDLGRNDIGKLSEIDSVKVTNYKVLQRFSHVTHITSTVTGKLKEGFTSVDVIRSVLPAGTLSGAPKVRAMEIIDELEEERRGIYGGGIGYIGYDGNMDTCIAIRTIVKKEGIAYVGAGGGIVLDSDPECEYQESVNKASALFEAVKKVGEIL